MVRGLVGVWAALGLALSGAGAAGAAGAPQAARARDAVARGGDAIASVRGSVVSLSDPLVVRRWQIDAAGHVVTAELTDPLAGKQWSSSGSPDFSVTLDSAATSSVSGWKLIDVTARPLAADPARPQATPGVELLFRYALVASLAPLSSGPLELDRSYTLHSGSAVLGASTTIVNHTPAPFRVGVYSLQELTSPARVNTEVQTYHGGSDWRDDYRLVKAEGATFDDEGEVARFDDGRGEGWFLVDERRSGSISRVGMGPGGRSWTGVDNARDVLDEGPLMSSPPSYNRVDNPAYPAPVRQRTLMPDGTLDLGRAFLGVYHGGSQAAAATFVTDFAANEMPAPARGIDLNTFHPWSHGPGLSDANLRAQVDAFAALGGRTFMLDDQWQGASSGDWQWDTARFPIAGNDGVPEFVKYLHGKGLSLGLWMSPAEFNPSSATYAAHRDWACTPTGDLTAQIHDDAGLGVWDMTNHALRAHLTNAVDRLIAQDGVTEFKFDYAAWVDCPPHDYLDYEDAYVAWVRSIQARHPNVRFELDETNDQRLWPFESAALGPSWFDNGHLHGSTYQAKLLHDIWTAAPWLPPSSIGAGAYDGTLGGQYTVDYLMPISLLGHFTFWTDLTKLSPADAAETAWWINWHSGHGSSLAGLVYEDTSTDPLDGRAWAAFQPWRGDRGYLFAFRQAGGPGTQAIALQSLDGTTMYRVANVRTGTVLGDYTGAELERGLAVTLATPYSAVVLSVRPV